MPLCVCVCDVPTHVSLKVTVDTTGLNAEFSRVSGMEGLFS